MTRMRDSSDESSMAKLVRRNFSRVRNEILSIYQNENENGSLVSEISLLFGFTIPKIDSDEQPGDVLLVVIFFRNTKYCTAIICKQFDGLCPLHSTIAEYFPGVNRYLSTSLPTHRSNRPPLRLPSWTSSDKFLKKKNSRLDTMVI